MISNVNNILPCIPLSLVISPLPTQITQFLVALRCNWEKECSTLEFANVPNVEDARIEMVGCACWKLQYCPVKVKHDINGIIGILKTVFTRISLNVILT